MKKLTLLLLAVIGSIVATNAQARIFGYLPDYRDPSTINFANVTDVGFSFLNPTTNGNLITSGGSAVFGFNSARFTQTKTLASQNGVGVWVTIGGADDNELRAGRLTSVCSNTIKRATFISELVAFGVQHSLSGIVVDWEFPKTNSSRTAHQNLIIDLEAAIAASARPSMLIAAAVGGETLGGINHTQFINSATFSHIDEFHVMAYDFPNNNSNYSSASHSSHVDAMNALDGWAAKGIPSDKLLLAVPLYGRHSNNRANVIEYKALPSNNTVFTSDTYNGYLYNGKTTIKQKIVGAFAKGAKGIVIWDLGQDKSGQYSLTTVIKTEVDIHCSLSQPALGPDQGVCGAVNITLNSGLATTGGATVKWYKDGAIISGASGLTYTVTAKGIYKIELEEAGGGCKKADEMEIVAGSALSASSTTDGTAGVCPGNAVTLSVNNASGSNYQWYDAAVGGAQVGSAGASLTENPSATTTYFVEEQSSAVTTTGFGRTTLGGLTAAPWLWAQKLGEVTHMIHVSQSITIQDLAVYVGGHGTVKIIVMDKFGNPVVGAESNEVAFNTGEKTDGNWIVTAVTIPCNIALQPGDYFLVPVGTDSGDETTFIQSWDQVSKTIGAKIYLELWTDGTNDLAGKPTATATVFGSAVPSFIIEDGGSEVFAMDAECDIAWAGWTGEQLPVAYWHSAFNTSQLADWRALPVASQGKYGEIFNITIVAGAASSCPRAEAIALVKSCVPLSIAINSPSNGTTIASSDGNAITSMIDVTALGSDLTGVSYEIKEYDENDNLLNTYNLTGQASNGYDVSYTFDKNSKWVITVTATDGTNNEVATVTITTSAIAGNQEAFAAAGMKLFPNPTSSNVTLDINGVIQGEYSVVVSDVNGRIVYTTIASGNLVLGNDLASGIYTIEVVSNTNAYTTRFVKQ